MLIYIIIAVASGISNLVARNINSILAEKIGLLEGTFFNYVTGLFLSLIFFLLSGEFLNFSFDLFKNLPLHAYLGGLVGVLVVALSNIVTPKISALYFTLIMFLGQLFTGMAIDYFTSGILSIGKLAGGCLVILGLGYNLYIDKKTLA